MIYTLEEIKSIVIENERKRNELADSIKQKKDESAKIEEQMQNALKKNSPDDYSRFYLKKIALENEIKALQEFLDKSSINGQFSKADIMESWNAYVEKQDKVMSGKLKKYEEAKANLIKYMEDIRATEKESNSVRHEFISFSRTDAGFKSCLTLDDDYYQTYIESMVRLYNSQGKRFE